MPHPVTKQTLDQLMLGRELSRKLPESLVPILREICHNDNVLKVAPEARSCLVFFNHLTEEKGGGLNRRSIHGSCPVVNQEKWIAQIWLHHEPWGSGVTDFW